MPTPRARAASGIQSRQRPRPGAAHGDRDVWMNPPPIPLTTPEMDYVYDLPYARAPHPAYEGARIPAWEMIRFSVNIMRGCFGGCTFCSITEHEGRIIQSRSEAPSCARSRRSATRRPASPASSRTSAGRPPTCTGMACKSRRSNQPAAPVLRFSRHLRKPQYQPLRRWSSFTARRAPCPASRRC
jgi:hypothetical protein